MIERIVKRDGRVVPFDKEKIAFAVLRAAVAVGGRNREVADSIADKVVALLESRMLAERGARTASYPTVEEVQDAVEKILIEEGHARTAKAYIIYRYEHALKRAGRDSLTYSSENVPYKKLWETLTWATDNSCYSLSQIRDYVSSGRFPHLVGASEQFYASQLDLVEQEIRKRIDEVRVIIVSGPSSSGKTTTTIKIGERLAPLGRRFVPLNVDHYFYDLDEHPRDPHGDYDFETPQALDLETLNDHLEKLLAGNSVDIPYYNFKTGRREGISSTMKLAPGDIVLIDSLHGFHEPMTEAVPREQKFKVYIETLAQVKDDANRFIQWSDIRMMRRMVRDQQFRNYNPRQTLLHWYLVRRSELRYIISKIRLADVIVNSFFPAELPLLKRRLAEYFPEFVLELSDDPDRLDALGRARRVETLFREVPDIEESAESAVPKDSLLREFIGGSVYSY
ncbi:ATP cone domain-containing protein [Salinispira pacifica]